MTAISQIFSMESMAPFRPAAARGHKSISGVARPAAAASRLTIDSVIHEIPAEPAATSRNRGWPGVTIDVYDRMQVNMKAVPAYDHHLIVYCSSVGGRLVQKRAGKMHDSRLAAGMSIFMPAGYEASWEGDVPASTRIRVPVELVVRAKEEIGTAKIELLNNFGTRDTTVEFFARILMEELGKPSHPAQPIIIDSVSCAIAVHLLRNYNALDAAFASRSPALAPRTVGEIVSYVEDNMHASIGLFELAAVAGISRFHFTRLFKNSLGETPMSYVERMRIERAKGLIHQGRLTLVDIALTVGFADQSHFTRRFCRQVGCTPAAYARSLGIRLLPRR